MRPSIFRAYLTGFFTLAFLLGGSLAHSQQDENKQPDTDIAGSTVFSVARGQPFKFFTFTLQNDFFVGDDSGFTGSIGLTSGTGPFLNFSKDNLPFHLEFLSRNLYIRTQPNKVRGVAHQYFQILQTPQDISATELQVDDVPYVGLAAVQSSLYSWDKNRSDELSLYLGAVGPIVLGMESQSALHELTDSIQPEGWDNQIDNEFVFKIRARQSRKLFRNYSGKYGYDVLGIGVASLGTIQSDLLTGVAVRWGTNLEYSHSTFNLEPDRQVNSLALSSRNDFFVYLGVRIGFVANDIFINGNTFEDSHSVDLKHFRDQVSTGVVWKRNKFAYVFQFSSQGPRTPLVTRRDTFGAFSITYPF